MATDRQVTNNKGAVSAVLDEVANITFWIAFVAFIIICVLYFLLWIQKEHIDEVYRSFGLGLLINIAGVLIVYIILNFFFNRLKNIQVEHWEQHFADEIAEQTKSKILNLFASNSFEKEIVQINQDNLVARSEALKELLKRLIGEWKKDTNNKGCDWKHTDFIGLVSNDSLTQEDLNEVLEYIEKLN